MSTPRLPRKYQPVWQQLKTTGVCRLSAAPQFHKRIVKAIFKERGLDQAWGLQVAEAGQRFKLQFESKSALLVLKLVKADGLNAEDL